MPSLYLNGHDTEARLDGERVQVTRIVEGKDDVQTLRVRFHDLDQVVVVGRAGLTTPLIQRLARENIPVHFLSGGGRWLGTLHPTANGHALRRLRQYDLARDSRFALGLARRLVAAKVRNSRRVLQRLAANREESANPAQTEATNSLQSLLPRIGVAESLDSLRGLEGLAGAVYFERLAAFFPPAIPFHSRSRRPPRDPANAMLSWTYTIALAEIDAAVRVAGLDPCLGFLHEISYGRPSLALDLLEPLRAPLCDLLVLKLLNHQQLKPEHFEFHTDDGGTYLSADARKLFFCEYERAMTRRFAEEKHGSHTDFRRVIRDQVNEVLHAMEGRQPGDFFTMP